MWQSLTAAAALAMFCVAADASARTWTSASGAVQIEAELIEKRADGTVVLKKADGVTIETRPEKFSAADQEYIRKWIAPAKAPAAEAPEKEPPQAAVVSQVPKSSLPPEAVAVAAKIKSAAAKSAIQEFEKSNQDLAVPHREKHKQYREKLAAMLEDCLKEASAAGNLDDALAIRNAVKELKSGESPAAWNFKSPKANDAVRKYKAACKKLDEAYEQQVKQNRTALVGKLEDAVKEVTKAQDLDEAIVIRDTIKAIGTARQVEESKSIATGQDSSGNSTATAKTKPKPQIPKNAVRFKGHKYFINTDATSWAEAKEKCEAVGGHLARIKTPEQQAFLSALIRQGMTDAWIDGSNAENRSKWVFSDGKEMPFFNWSKDGHPAANTPERNYVYTGVGWGGRWGVAPADEKLPYVCEWDK